MCRFCSRAIAERLRGLNGNAQNTNAERVEIRGYRLRKLVPRDRCGAGVLLLSAALLIVYVARIL